MKSINPRLVLLSDSCFVNHQDNTALYFYLVTTISDQDSISLDIGSVEGVSRHPESSALLSLNLFFEIKVYEETISLILGISITFPSQCST